MAITIRNPDFKVLGEKIRQQMNDVSDNILNGSCADYAEYKEKIGIIQGLARAERDLLDLDRAQFVEDDDQD